MTKRVPDRADASDPVSMSVGSSPSGVPRIVDEVAATGIGVSFPIVGVGASAGGMDAVTQLLRALPIDTGLSFVIIQHLAPDHPSNLAEILSRATMMPVGEVRDEPEVEPNRVYVIPPGRNMIIAGGKLILMPQDRYARRHGIDQFFASLAEDCGHKAIGVVLSGAMSDGTLGTEQSRRRAASRSHKMTPPNMTACHAALWPRVAWTSYYHQARSQTNSPASQAILT